MTTHIRDIASLVGRTIIGIDVEGGDVEIHIDNGDEYMMEGIADIDGDMADLCDKECSGAKFCAIDNTYVLETEDGVVSFGHTGSTQFVRIL